MLKTLAPEVEGHRIAGAPDDGPMGAFRLRCPHTGERLLVIASDGADWQECGFPPPAWEHVSVSHPRRCPSWEEMHWIKGLFWSPQECVMQLHPPESQYVNNHPFCLHLWRVVGRDHPLPPAATVGCKAAGVLTRGKA